MASSISAGTTSGTALVHTADTTGALQLATNNGTVAVTINTSQNVGIGTTSPAYKLDVNGDANVPADSSYFIGAGADRYIKYRSGNGDILYSFSAGNFYQQHITSSYHAWFTSNNERMRITTAGVIQAGTGAGEVFAQNTVKAWGVIVGSNGTLYNSFGISSSSRISTGIYAIGFTRTLSSSRFGSGTNPYGGGYSFINTESTTGCRVNVVNSSGTAVDGDCMFLIAGGS